MSEKQFREYMAAIKSVGERMERDEAYARRVFIESGILDENGNLTEHYRPRNVHTSPEPTPRVSWVRP